MKVAIAVIMNKNKEILITQRAAGDLHGGFWEFPGGKLEQGESAEAALIREIREEIGIDVIEHRFLKQIDHLYGERFVSLLVYFVTMFEGEASRREAQLDLRWVNKCDLTQFTFPAANEQILDLINEL